ncbi:hypothetical protein [Qipengyuania sp. ASV99]|uniref:hypothetical protein n=1 Tax=Qipengyuania sp. ASV99 TaxID=3399681 RepID=UPI003A4C6967
MKKFATLGVLGSAGLFLAACGSSDDASTEAMPDTVEMPADEALEPIAEEPVADDEALGPPVDPSENAPDPVTTEQVADDAAAVAAEAEAAAEAAEAAIPVE